MHCDHVAVLVADLDAALASLGPIASHSGPREEFPDEGTREVYIGSGTARLLLLEPIGPGPYRHAMDRRGPGLHHVCLAGGDPERLLQSLTGWLLHPHSLASGPDTLWACRPGLPLAELVREAPSGEPLVTGLEVACPPGLETHVARLSSPGFAVSAAPQTRLCLAGHHWAPPS